MPTTTPDMASAPPTDVIAPQAPHDDLGFDRLATEYNFLNISSYGRVLTNLVAEETRSRVADGISPNVLDVGCGCGIGREAAFQWAIRETLSGGEFWGLEPDEGVKAAGGLFDNYQHALMETAQLPTGHFDVAYSSMVMEHVADPAAFLAAVGRCLKPGGVYLFATPNARSFVPLATKILHKLRVDELALRLVRGKQQIDEYHYPVQFRFNSPRQVARYAEQHGFDPPQCAFIEGTGSYSYFRGPLKVLGPLLQFKRKLVRRPDRLATLLCKLRKSAKVS